LRETNVDVDELLDEVTIIEALAFLRSVRLHNPRTDRICFTLTNLPDDPQRPAPSPAPPEYYDSGVPTRTPRYESSPSSRKSAIAGWLVAAVVVVVITAFATAQHWTKVDVPEQAETVHTEEFLTGNFNITNDSVSPCWVNQDWTDCINLMVNEYNGACTGVSLAWRASSSCALYLEQIDKMRQMGRTGSTVKSLGGFGHLNRSAVSDTREVSNNDYRPAVTHEAVCYLAFIGECK
jgi:hypothetical protein